VSYVANSHILIASTLNEWESRDFDKSIVVMKIDLSDIWEYYKMIAPHQYLELMFHPEIVLVSQ
jgi:predicted alpha/beta-fold hydrolase